MVKHVCLSSMIAPIYLATKQFISDVIIIIKHGGLYFLLLYDIIIHFNIHPEFTFIIIMI